MARHVAVAIALLACMVAAAREVAAAQPPTVEPQKRYLFYLHGAWIEEHGLREANPQHGRYQYEEIKSALSAAGFTVYSEARLSPVDVEMYAHGVVREVRDLITSGVAEDRISIAGHSKGARIVLEVATELALPRVRFVVMAGCPKSDAAVWPRASLLQGRILSLYDGGDTLAGSCRAIFEKADPSKVETREVVLDTGKGHGLFYSPSGVWVDEIVRWAN